ncbi:MAG: hypothetical protein ACXWFZ_13245, partial [Nitrososphaeraceae archaeon]
TEGGENMMQEFILKTKFVSLDRFRADWNAWSAHQNFKDWLEVPGKTNAIIGLESNIIKWGTDQAVHGIRSTLGGTASQVSSAISTRKALSTLGDTFNVIGKVSGVGDIISSGVDFILTMNDPTASTGDKVLAGGKVVADILITFAKMHPGVRLAGTIVSFFW